MLPAAGCGSYHLFIASEHILASWRVRQSQASQRACTVVAHHSRHVRAGVVAISDTPERTLTPRTPAILFIAAAVIALVVLYGLCDPCQRWFPHCIWHTVTGTLCPGCGSQRAIHALLHGQIIQAWHYNALMLVAAPCALMAVAAEVWPNRLPRMHRMVTHRATGITVIGIIALWWILRNI